MIVNITSKQIKIPLSPLSSEHYCWPLCQSLTLEQHCQDLQPSKASGTQNLLELPPLLLKLHFDAKKNFPVLDTLNSEKAEQVLREP